MLFTGNLSEEVTNKLRECGESDALWQWHFRLDCSWRPAYLDQAEIGKERSYQCERTH